MKRVAVWIALLSFFSIGQALAVPNNRAPRKKLHVQPAPQIQVIPPKPAPTLTLSPRALESAMAGIGNPNQPNQKNELGEKFSLEKQAEYEKFNDAVQKSVRIEAGGGVIHARPWALDFEKKWDFPTTASGGN